MTSSPEILTQAVQEAKESATAYTEAMQQEEGREQLEALKREMAPKYVRAKLSKLAQSVDPTNIYATKPASYEVVS